MPLLFQRRFGAEYRPISAAAIRQLINIALTAAGVTDADGRPLRFAPHDFRQDLRHRRDHARDATAHRAAAGRPPRHQHHDGLQGRLPRRGHQRPPRVHRPPPGATAQPRNTAPPPTRNGRSSSATSNAARCPWAPAAGPTPPPAPTTLLHPLPAAAPRPGPTRPAGTIRDNLQARIARSPPAGLGRGSRGPEDQPRRHTGKLAQTDQITARRAAAVDLGLPTFPDVAAHTVTTTETLHRDGQPR